MTVPLQFASLYYRPEIFMWSSCLLDLGTDFLVGNMVFVRDMPESRGLGDVYKRQHLSLNRESLWGTTDNFATSFLHFSLFSTVLWDLPNSSSVHYLMLSSHLFLCLPCLHPPFTVPCKMVFARPDERET